MLMPSYELVLRFCLQINQITSFLSSNAIIVRVEPCRDTNRLDLTVVQPQLAYIKGGFSSGFYSQVRGQYWLIDIDPSQFLGLSYF